ncbi:hypothetical protein DQE82_19720 [Micromonospora sp. LHW51205]|uniref:hypothetical protein n=1 Tax=Micromonospora sp. LHW51205 TaxID=2248752 RepID=UPI000DE82B3B|nr:hypothetical protein [Micromonospora sp. LHW51205]RBQ07145.1 hypothetical protein DQE82_19720 [Micromonospora sp. LHW51205]
MAHEQRSDAVDQNHSRTAALDDKTVEALGELSKALETIHRVRGHLYSAHQLVGGADLTLDRVVKLLREAGHDEMANRVEHELLGRNLLPGRWTFQIVEEFDDGYYAAFQEIERDARETLAGGRRHIYEAEMKERRRTHGMPGHEATPEE